MKVTIDSEKLIKILAAEQQFCTVINDFTREILEKMSEKEDTSPEVD